MWVWFERPLLPGYGWSFPLADGAVNIGVVTAGISGKRFADAWRTTLDGAFVRSLAGASASLEAPARAWPIPARLDVAALSAFDHRVLFVGDAAGAADPFTGEGIGQALETGIAAGLAIADNIARGHAQVAAAYRQAIATSLAKDHAIRARVPTALRSRVERRRGLARRRFHAVRSPQRRPLAVRGLSAGGRHLSGGLAGGGAPATGCFRGVIAARQDPVATEPFEGIPSNRGGRRARARSPYRGRWTRGCVVRAARLLDGVGAPA